MTTYRATWPILDPHTTLADLLGTGMADLRTMLTAENTHQAGPVTWTIRQRGHRILLTADVPTARGGEQTPPPPTWRTAAHANGAILAELVADGCHHVRHGRPHRRSTERAA